MSHHSPSQDLIDMRAAFRHTIDEWTHAEAGFDGIGDLFDMLNERGFLVSPIVYADVKKFWRPNNDLSRGTHTNDT